MPGVSWEKRQTRPFHDLTAVKAELASLYQAARSKQVDPKILPHMVLILRTLADIIRRIREEKKQDELEEKIAVLAMIQRGVPLEQLPDWVTRPVLEHAKLIEHGRPEAFEQVAVP